MNILEPGNTILFLFLVIRVSTWDHSQSWWLEIWIGVTYIYISLLRDPMHRAMFGKLLLMQLEGIGFAFASEAKFLDHEKFWRIIS